jgi:hypothetical protein
MLGRNIGLCLAAACIAGFGSGCKKSPPEQPSQNPPAQAASQPTAKLETVARIHWLGKKRIAAETNSASFMSIWNMPESQKLEAQTLDKFALAPWGLPREGTNTAAIVATNPPSLLLRPLLEDLLQEECYLEIRGSGERPRESQTEPGGASVPASRSTPDTRDAARTEMAVAVRLDENRSHLWKTNLTAVLNSLTNHQSLFTDHQPPTFLRAGNWTVVVLSSINSPIHQSTNSPRSSNNPTIQQSNNPASAPPALPEWVQQLANQLGQNSDLFVSSNNPASSSANPQIQQSNNPTSDWLETELDLNGISSALGLGWRLPREMPKVMLTMSGEGELLRTTGRLNFEKPLPLELKPWNIPTNLIHDPLTSFTAIRGIKLWPSLAKAWNDLQLGPAPNQLFVWGQGGLPITTFWAAPLPDASNHIHQFTEHLIHDVNPWFATNSMGQFQRATNANAAIWGSLPFVEPYLRSAALPEGDFIFGSVGASPSTNRPTPALLLEQFISRSDLIAYDWELTAARIEPALYNIQFLRFVFQKAQVPPESTSMNWLQALEGKLGNCATSVSLTSSNTLSFVRTSGLGLTAVELQILADWLESPKFPNGLNTFVGQPEPLPTHKHRTNSVPQPAPAK